MSKDQGSKPSIYLKMQILPTVIHLGEPHVTGGASKIENSSAHLFVKNLVSCLKAKGPTNYF
jgi:hypothetical protein